MTIAVLGMSGAKMYRYLVVHGIPGKEDDTFEYRSAEVARLPEAQREALRRLSRGEFKIAVAEDGTLTLLP